MARYSSPRRGQTFALVALSLIVVSGCGGKFPPMVPVVGTVMMDDKPVAHGTVTFYPDKTKGNLSTFQPIGYLDEKGEYRLVTPSNQGAKEGAPPGWYRVSVSSMGPPPLQLTQPPESQVKGGPKKPKNYGKYENPKTSGLAIEVAPNAPPGAYDLNLTK